MKSDKSDESDKRKQQKIIWTNLQNECNIPITIATFRKYRFFFMTPTTYTNVNMTVRFIINKNIAKIFTLISATITKWLLKD